MTSRQQHPPSREAEPLHSMPALEEVPLLSSKRRGLMLGVCTLQAAVTGCVYLGWSPLSSLLLRAEVFSRECEREGDGSFRGDRRGSGEEFICDAQDAAVQHLYGFTLAVHFTTSALAGCLVDTLGPKVTSVLGQAFNCAGWGLLASMDALSHARVYLSFLFIGMGADTAFLPTLVVSRLFPRASGLVIALLGAACSVSFAIPLLLLWLLPHGDLSGCLWYAALGPGFFAAVNCICMPQKKFEIHEKTRRSSVSQSEEAHEADAILESPGQLETIPLGIVPSEPVEMRGHPTEGQSPPRQFEVSPSLLHSVLSERFILLVLHFSGVGFLSAFYQEAHGRLLTIEAQQFLGLSLPLSFVPCMLLGLLSDRVGIVPVMMFVNAAGLAAFLFTLASQQLAGYLSVSCFVVYMALFSSQAFIYIEQTFSQKHFGRLAGLVELTGGLCSLLCSRVYSRAVLGGDNPKESGIISVQLFCLFLFLVEFAVLSRLLFVSSRCSDPPHGIRSHTATAREGV